LNPNNHLQNCEQLTQDFCRQLVQQCWHQLERRLGQQAQRLNDKQRRAQRYLEMQEIRFKVDQVHASISRHNRQNFASFRELLPLATEAANKGHIPSSQEKQQDFMAINRVIQDTLHHHQSALSHLNQRLAVARGGQRCEDRDNPLSPAALCLAFQHSVRQLDIEARLRLELYEIFGRLLSENIGRFYRKVNQFLVANGILPNLLPQNSSIAGASRVPQAANEDASALAQNELRLNQINSLLQGQLQLPAAIRNAIDIAEKLPNDSYLVACSLLQRQIAEHVDFKRDQLIDPQSTKRQYYKYLAAQVHQHKSGVDSSTLLAIELVSRIFAVLASDNLLPLELRCLLSYLHAPCIKLVISDRQFFISAMHPARQLLDLMLQPGSLWLLSQTEDERLFDTMRSVVSSIASEQAKTNFGSALHEFQQCLTHLQQQAEQCEQREVQAQSSMESLDEARSRAKQQVQAVMSQYRVSAETHDQLSGSCIDFLAFILLQHGDGRQWIQAQHLLKGIALSVQGQLPRQQLVQFQRGQQRLYNVVRRGLGESGYRGMLATDLLETLSEAQRRLIHDLAVSDTPVRNNPRIQAGHGFHLLEQLHIGHWYQFSDRPRSGPILLKLAWRSKGWTRAMFVDASGVRRRLEYADTLASALRLKQLRASELSPGQSSNTALDAILHQLRLDALRRKFSHKDARSNRPELKIC
jgi:hypothetical protein